MMANKSSKPKEQTVRERANKQQAKKSKPRRLSNKASSAKKPVKSALGFSKKEVHLPYSKEKHDKFFHKKRSFVPTYFRESWQELKKVTWPDRAQTTKLTIAVMIFAVAFALMIAVVDYFLDKLFKGLIL